MTPSFFDLMIDLETMGLPPTGAIVSIGAVFFDLHTQTLGPEYHATIHLGSAMADGGTVDPGTIMFWLGQPDAARNAIRYQTRHVHVVLDEFADWIAQTCRHEDVRPWGNGASFDLTLLNGAYQRAKKRTPWYFTNERCFRTVRNMYPQVEYNPGDKGDDAHNALSDAVFQAQHLFKIKESRKKAA